MVSANWAMVLLLQATPAASSVPTYQIESRVQTLSGELLGMPSVTAVAHEPASVMTAASHGRTLKFQIVVKPQKDGQCDKIMVIVDLKGPTRRDQPGLYWTSHLWQTCDETMSTVEGAFAISLRVKRNDPPAEAAPTNDSQ